VKGCAQPEGGWAEGWFYSAHGPSYAHAPRCVSVDRDSRVVVLEFSATAFDLQTIAASDPMRALRMLASLGGPVAELHDRPLSAGAPRSDPVLPRVAYPSAVAVQSATAAFRDCLRDLQNRHRLVAEYEGWRKSLRTNALVHGDIKADNILIDSNSVKIIDWELSGVGDPRVDIGGLIGSMVIVWLDALALDSAEAPEAWVADSAVSFRSLRAAVTDFLSAYSQSPVDDQFVLNSVISAACWLVARAVAEASLSRIYEPSVMLKLRVADALVADPRRICR
jgi:serine/threonine protein kinase